MRCLLSRKCVCARLYVLQVGSSHAAPEAPIRTACHRTEAAARACLRLAGWISKQHETVRAGRRTTALRLSAAEAAKRGGGAASLEELSGADRHAHLASSSSCPTPGRRWDSGFTSPNSSCTVLQLMRSVEIV